MDIQKKKLIGRNQIIVAGLIILSLITTVLFFRYEGETLLDILMPHQQVTYYKISEQKQESYIALPQTITVYKEQFMLGIVKDSDIQCTSDKEDIKVYE